jgi:hypothetical protein
MSKWSYLLKISLYHADDFYKISLYHITQKFIKKKKKVLFHSKKLYMKKVYYKSFYHSKKVFISHKKHWAVNRY